MAPDLQSEVRAAGLTYELARSLEVASHSMPQLLPVYASRGQFSRTPYLALPVHDLLTEDADWDAAAWDLDTGGSHRLAATLEWLDEQLSGGFEFFAAWPPESIDTVVDVSITELAQIVRGGKVATRTRYLVRAAPAA